MNVNFNTLNNSCTTNRYHILNFEQVQYLDDIMNTYISISPNPRLQNLLGTNTVISPGLPTTTSSTSSTVINKPCSCFSSMNSTNFNNTENSDHIDTINSSSISTTVPISKINNLVTSIPEGFSNSTNIDNTINNPYQHSINDCCLPNHHIPFILQQSQKLPTIRIQLKKLIRIIRDGLLKESIPVKEIRLNGDVASSIIIGKF
ncbi:hypothetical protein Smp_063150 [Schistosoma mansoni]|uniref:hypothetical protein n=1 Tax=Schistosoma mansoni TaxID=6183 RepID=UPI00022DC1BE|nr:hypothetical protein Smp_063150 [Schistosoma mansoni]|eukprot:XP_018653278.1 hypothetical protein Smp_063150 [Schistosoma mansoni]